MRLKPLLDSTFHLSLQERDNASWSLALIDPKQGQVFIILISSAIKYNNDPAAWIRIRSRVNEDLHEVFVEDNGPGIRPDEREAIFSKFPHGRAHTQTSAAGAGLELAIYWQIMRWLDGSLTLEPKDGPGACFRVALPGTCKAPLACRHSRS